MFDNIKQDYWRSCYFRKIPCRHSIVRIFLWAMQDSGFRAVMFYRMGRWCRVKKLNVIAALLERMMRHTSHCWISTLAEIGPGFVVAHVCGIVIPPETRIGRNCTIRHNASLGGNYGKKGVDGRGTPTLGDDISIGPGAVILGPITVGSNTIIGANAVVTKSVPENSVVGAFRAEVLGQRTKDGGIERPFKEAFLSRKELFERIRELENRVDKLDNQK